MFAEGEGGSLSGCREGVRERDCLTEREREREREEACLQRGRSVRVYLQGEREHAHGAADAVPPSDPVPELKGVVRVDPKLADQLLVCGHFSD